MSTPGHSFGTWQGLGLMVEGEATARGRKHLGAWGLSAFAVKTLGLTLPI